MSSRCVEKLPHECGSSDGLQVFVDNNGNYTGYCFACKTYVEDPYNGKVPKDPPKFKKDPEEDLQEIETLSAVALPDRKLRQETLDYFGIKIGLSEEDGSSPVFHYYPYPHDKGIAYKVRFVPGKKFWTVGNIKAGKLFGLDQAVKTGARKLFIVEGELISRD